MRVPGDGAMDIDIEMGDMESDLDPTLTSFQASAIIAVCAAVLIGNGFVCALNCFKTQAQGFYLKFVLLSAAMNMTASLVCMPLMASSLIQAEWRFGYLLCKMTGVICFSSMIITMFFCILASLSKGILFTKTLFPKRGVNLITERDFIIICIVLGFVVLSSLVLFLLVDHKKMRQDPQRMMCTYANSPNITGYRMFYVAYSVLLTFADLLLVIPISSAS